MNKKLTKKEYKMSALELAPYLIGKLLVRKHDDGKIEKLRILETEIYYGESDTACHARVGRTKRTSIMYEEGGVIYVYLIYGMYHILNIISGPKEHPEGVMIRVIEGFDGPGKLTRHLNINLNHRGLDLENNNEIWIEDDGKQFDYITKPRVGINYATEEYRDILWRYVLKK